jgi:hypothetical protein
MQGLDIRLGRFILIPDIEPRLACTGVSTRQADVALGWQHWFSPQIDIRPEIA